MSRHAQEARKATEQEHRAQAQGLLTDGEERRANHATELPRGCCDTHAGAARGGREALRGHQVRGDAHQWHHEATHHVQHAQQPQCSTAEESKMSTKKA
eukprot:CAMPEP_0179182592 /NCGR_PEP_ID=MMETSP0796-20121207/90476_1 /TAXON_ID=73915 /ORGANISM="Pyrodinium bahamense, Strain pbaha01" /LENGTH=98 /DNA_ID=CAMNT_0020886441 /DNA_START=152 /DNA_END=449 /DNA_ORIENTATION=-